MTVLALQGVRGGVGTTSLTAALGWALHQLGESVLVIDASPDNLLRLAFNIDFDHADGWARALLDDKPWQSTAWRYAPGLDVLPYGSLRQAEWENSGALTASLGVFANHLQHLKASGHWRWILLDLPCGFDAVTRSLLQVADRTLCVVQPDANCHARLHQQALPKGGDLLANFRLISSQVQNDIWQLWLQTQRNLVPVAIHRDEAMMESFAAKQPVGEYRPDSLVAEEIVTLANWCLLHYGRERA
ncbi:cellulose synthase operon protein YhjQ [Cronobacter muytjensii]|nr:cellulose synthase operon protein YhjQ [Cronobacter muytjensii]